MNIKGFLAEQAERKTEKTVALPEKTVALPVLRQQLAIFANNQEDIGNRVLLAFDADPFAENPRVTWDSFSRLKSVLVNRESSILDRVNFLCKVNSGSAISTSSLSSSALDTKPRP